LKNLNATSFALIFFFFGLLLLNHFLGFTGPFGFDDIEYARLGHLFANGNPDYTNPFTFRFGVIFPIGYLQNWFGITDHAASIYPLLLSFVLIIIVFKCSNSNWKTALIALNILFCCPWIVFYSDKIGADIPVTVYMILAIYIFYLSRFVNRIKKQISLQAVLFSVTIFVASLTKETVWFLLPLLAIFFVYDVFKKQNLQFWIFASLTVFVLMFGYLLWQKIQFDDCFYRFKLIKANDNTNLCSYDRQPFPIVFKRITTDLWVYLMTESAFVIPIVLLIGTLSKKYFLKPFAKENFWQTVSIILILSANFWTISYNSYHPLCVDVRHYLYIFPVCAIAIATNYEMLFRKWAVIMVLLVSVLILVFKNQLQLKEITILNTYFILAIFTPLLFIKKGKIYFLMALISIPLFNIYRQIKNASEYNYPLQEKVARDFLKDKHDVTIYTSEAQKRLFIYYLGFSESKKIAISPYHYFSDLEAGYHYWNYHSIALSQIADAIPAAINAISIPKNLIQQEVDIIKIYQIKNPQINLETYHFGSPFLNVLPNSKGVVEILPNQEFGLTFSKPISNTIHQIDISGSYKIVNKTLNDANLVFSLEEDGKLLYYQAYSIKTDRATLNNLYKLVKGVSIKGINIKKEAILKLYIWNNQSANLNITEAEINLAIE
jgi:hypothetical protein